MPDALTPAEVLARAAELRGSAVVVVGTLEVGAATAHLEGDAATARVDIHDPGLLDLLLPAVPAAGGGRYAYRDAAVVEAVVDEDAGSAVLTAVRSVEIRRGTTTYRVGATGAP
ncbi:hypothetical protein ACFO3K_16185 [Cellulomonas algicola]|uniref:Uncharacterized protein n=1 Tax=Cellulomonas algicola TaxID=2071633 RepID=A0A401V1V8_9CELL|nr:hypothetical protein [Cellulomonas algicola]GCD20891.1 hypothetical protein CTKZ_24530 [Cellulomonas algicola]